MIAAIVQARTGSTRFPSKILKKIEGKSLIWHVINRVKESKLINKIIIATTEEERDKEIIKLAKKWKIPHFAGSSEDVLDRFYQAAKDFSSDAIIVRITPDDPFKDPRIIDKFIKYFLINKSRLDYLSNTIEPTYPDGLDVEIFKFKALEKAWQEAEKFSEREHVTPYIWKNPEKFQIENLSYKKNLSYLRWTIDYPKDLKFAREIYKRIYAKKKTFSMDDILKIIKKEPDLVKINQGIIYKEGYLKSLEKDKLKK